jgi:hypothetical protein
MGFVSVGDIIVLYCLYIRASNTLTRSLDHIMSIWFEHLSTVFISRVHRPGHTRRH